MTSQRRRLRLRSAIAAAMVVAAAAGCGGGEQGKASEKLTVFAASSLTEVFGTLETAYEKDHPDVDVVLSLGSSTALAEQIQAGAPADVIATADEKSIGLVDSAGLLAGEPTRFAANTLALVTPADDPAGITSVADLSRAVFVVCDPSAPCGAAAETVLKAAGVRADAASYEPDVKAVLAKVTLHEADAGLVYVTDARAAGEKVHTIDIPAGVNVVNPYFIAAVKASPQASAAADWIDLVTSQSGREVLERAGFGVP